MKALESVVLVILAGAPMCLPAAEDVPATLHWERRVEMGVPVTGIVSQVLVKTGQHVSEGQTLVALDPRGFLARVAGAQARLNRVLPELEEAREELERSEDLYDRTLLSEHELQLAQIALAKLLADKEVAEARLARAELHLERSTVRAPFDGIVVTRAAEIGQSVVSHCESVPLVTVASNDRLVARAELPVRRITGLRIGQEIPVMAGTSTLTGRVATLAPEPLPGTLAEPRYAVEVLIPVPEDTPLLVGQKVVLKLP